MRILIITTFFPPLNSIASLRPNSWAKEWASLGHDVCVLTTKKYQNPEMDLKCAVKNIEVIEVESVFSLNRLKEGSLNSSVKKSALRQCFEKLRHHYGILNACRMPDLTHFWLKPAFKAVEKMQPWDVVVSSAGPYTVHILANKLKKYGKAKFWVADYRDTWSDSYIYPGLFPFNWIEKIWEKKLLKKADMITTISDPFRELFEKKYGKKAYTVFNGFDPDDLKQVSPQFAFPEDGKLRIVHTGSIYQKKRDPTPLFEAIQKIAMKTPSLLHFLEVIFVGANSESLQRQIEDFGVKKWVKYAGFVSREKALAMQRDAHMLLFLPWTDASVDGVLTGKIFEYLYSKTPMISVGSTHLDQSQKLILQLKAGSVFHASSEIEEFLVKELNDIRKRRLDISQELLESFNRSLIAKKFLNTIEMEKG